MLVRALFVIAVAMQLQFSVEGNCTTELSETDDAEATSSPGDVAQNGTQDQSSSKTDDAVIGTKKRKRTDHDDERMLVKDSNEPRDVPGSINQGSSQNSTWGIGKDAAEASILEEVSSDSEYESIVVDDRLSRDTGDPTIPQTMIGLEKLAVHKNSDTIDIDADQFDREGHMTLETMIDLGELAVHKNSDTIDIDADKFDIEGHLTSETVIDLGDRANSKKSSSNIQGDTSKPTIGGVPSPTQIGISAEKADDRDDFDSGNYVTAGIVVDFGDPDTKNKSSTDTKEDSGPPSQDGLSTESPEVHDDSDYEFSVKVGDGKRFNRNLDNQGVISNGSTVEVTGESIHQPIDVISTHQANSVASEDDIGDPSQDEGRTATVVSIEPLAKRLYKRLKRHDMETVTDSAVRVEDIAATSTANAQTEDTSLIMSTLDQINDTSKKEKLKRFPSLQYIARKAMSYTDGSRTPAPRGRKFRGKRSHVYSMHYDDIPESMKSESFKIFHKAKKLNKKHKI
ncbi:hypothetical protein GE061_009314 [Apolygus lucorum]|uniref:Folded gastrulation N-terminal domain-containing protein n=1 Tax=Apolygus lucorum TaxID=248454 RepID=A0A8S9Y1Y2_APOLU|nr:hypothetical protein GE061_009314 [Apolygus lucorum]